MKRFQKNNILLLSIWLCIQLSLIFFTGIRTEGEAKRFINEANLLINQHSFSSSVYLMYLIEILLVYIKLKFSLSYAFIVTVQLMLNAYAFFHFHKFINEKYKSQTFAYAGSILLLICWPYQIYNCFIYTESIFFSLSILFSCYLLSIHEFNTRKLIKVILFSILLCITRPSGIFFVLASFIYIFLRLAKKIPLYLKIVALFTIPSLILFVLNLMMKSGKGVDVLLPFIQEHIICDIPSSNHPYKSNSGENPGLFMLIEYILNQPLQFIRLGLLKTIAFFGLTRSYYSAPHNIFLCVYFYSMYAIILLGVIKRTFELNHKNLYFISLCGIYWLSVFFSCDEWHNRFFLTLTPFFILMSMESLSGWIKKKEV